MNHVIAQIFNIVADDPTGSVYAVDSKFQFRDGRGVKVSAHASDVAVALDFCVDRGILEKHSPTVFVRVSAS